MIRHLQATLDDPMTVARFRVSPQDFSRKRCLSFALVVLLMLRGHKQALQNTLNKLFLALDKVRAVPTASALCQARRKINPALFLHLQQQIIAQFYALPERDIAENMADETEFAWGVEVWHGHRILGVDGTRWNIPDTLANRTHFGCSTNQHPTFSCAQAQGSILYDVLNDIGLNAVLEPIQSEKSLLFAHHLPHTRPGDVIVMDRLYCDFSVLAFWSGHGREFVVRAPRTSFRAVRAFWSSSAREAVVTLTVTPDQKKWVSEQQLPQQVRVRLIKLTLPGGDEEVLVTSLCDAKGYPAQALCQVYAWRWRLESYIDRLKNIFEVERLGSLHPHHLAQDFFGIVFLATLESVLVRPAQESLLQRSQRSGGRYQWQVNRSVSYSALVEQTLVLLSDSKKSPQKVLSDLQRLFQTNPVPRREGRHFPRQRSSLSQKLRHHRYAKRALT